MSTSSPADLAVAVRSLHRRLDEASTDAPPAAIATARADVDAAVAAAAARLGCSASAETVAAAITSRRPEDWHDGALADVQASADAAARAIRALADAAERAR
ncbi:MAG: hypothetical protein JWL72_2998 [Ilumatobacteraceae bacterium]|nr:hypothetical protein [Ilumatobacteraceae bacterium]